MTHAYPIMIHPYIDGDWQGFVARYVGIPVEVYHEDEVQALKDLIDAKEEYYATLKKESNK